MRKMSSYLGFNGEELALFIELRDVFKLMNHNDSQQNFKREIKLFDRCIKKLTDLYQAGGNLAAVQDWNQPMHDPVEVAALREGGNPEMMAKVGKQAAKLKSELQKKPLSTAINAEVSEEGSDITA